MASGAAKEAVHVITTATRRKNMALAGALVAFVGSVYYFTYSKMKTNELEEVAKEFDLIREATGGVKPAAPAGAAGAASGNSAPAAGTPPAQQLK